MQKWLSQKGFEFWIIKYEMIQQFWEETESSEWVNEIKVMENQNLYDDIWGSMVYLTNCITFKL